MRELTVRISFTSHSLGNVKRGTGGLLFLPRTPDNSVMFLASWHRANMQMAARLMNRHQDEVGKILWDVAVDATVKPDARYRRYCIKTESGRQRYALHEALLPGQIVGINCAVPTPITDSDFWELMTLAGQYKGLSPYAPGEFGRFNVVSIRPRREAVSVNTEMACEKE